MTLIHDAAVLKHAWMTEDEFARDWALVQLAPGINLLGFTILLGRRIAGARGIAAAMIGLLLPSVAITVAITAAFAALQRSPVSAAAIHAVLPATIGLGVLMTVTMTLALIGPANGRLGDVVSAAIILLLASGWYALYNPPAVVVLLIGGLLGSVLGVICSRSDGSSGEGTP